MSTAVSGGPGWLTTPQLRLEARLRGVVVALGFVAALEVVFAPPVGLLVFGAVNGALYGLAASTVVLVHRSHRVLNFAAVAMGALPASVAMLLVVAHGLGWWPALAIALLGGAATGALVEVVVIRRFRRSSRLLLTVATLAVVQVISLVSERVAARLIADRTLPSRLPTPWSGWAWVDGRGSPILTGDHVAALVAVAVLGGSLAWFLRRTRAGVGLRACADDIERAQLLGVPVRQVQVAAWGIAGLIAAAVVFLRTPLVGAPLDATLGPNVTLIVLGAAVMAHLTRVPVAVAAAVGLGMLEQASIVRAGSSTFTPVLLLAVIVPALLLRRPHTVRSGEAEDGWWVGAGGTRPTGDALNATRTSAPSLRAPVALASLAVVAAPFLVSTGSLGKLTLVPITAIVALSVVVVTGWAGQLSLGQFALAGVAAAVAGGLAVNQQADFFVALVAGVAAGAAVSVVVGIPAARLRGVYLAVVTLAMAGTIEGFVLQRGNVVHRLLLPRGEAPRIDRPALWGVVNLADDRTFYFLAVAGLLLALYLVRSFRSSHVGRTVIGARDNPDAAAAHGVEVVRARLIACGLSGAIAGLAGVLLAYQQGSVDPGSFGVGPSVQVFLLAVLGGITSPLGAVAGVVVVRSAEFFLEPHVRDIALVFDGPLLLLVLIANPAGMSAIAGRIRTGGRAGRRTGRRAGQRDGDAHGGDADRIDVAEPVAAVAAGSGR